VKGNSVPPRTGRQFLQGLQQRPRDVWLAGEQVDDVTAHPALVNCARTLARLYDMQHDPETQEVVTYACPETGQREGTSFIIPRSVEDLIRRRDMVKTWADATCGMMGRTPDFLNVNLMGFAVRADYFAKNDPRFGDNIRRYYEYVRDHDLCLTHTLVNPQVDRSKPVTELDPYIGLGVVEETAEGLRVRGARMLATLAPFADELAVFPSTFRMEGQEAGKYALCFAIPLETPGLRFICREPFDYGKSVYDHPLGARFDEMDAVAVFKDVLVPWERVFLYRDVGLCNRVFADTGAIVHLMHQFVTRFVAKAEFVVGVTCFLAETIAIDGFLHVQEKIGELINFTAVMQACLRASEADATLSDTGVVCPAAEPLMTARTLFPVFYPRMVEILQLLGAGGYMMTPSERDLHGPLRADIDRYYQAAKAPAAERIRLFRLAWDIVGNAFGSRQLLYERYFSGDPVRLTAGRYLSYDKEPLMERVRAFLRQAE
jgi:4-hydroxyphenylacetate 3-monooxygenase